jgi:AraC-like DNA-binding protein
MIKVDDRRYISTRAERHEGVIDRFRSIVEANLVQPLSITETSGRIGISARSLRQICQEHFGVGPKQYWLYRRMDLAHRALISGERKVRDVATLYGFSELGRFSVITGRTASFACDPDFEPRPIIYFSVADICATIGSYVERSDAL